MKRTKTKIALCGKNLIAVNALKYLYDVVNILDINISVHTVTVNSDIGIDTWQPSFKRLAENLNIPVYNDIFSIELSSEDILISLEYDKIIQSQELNGARAYNIHFSNLPKYRGCLTSVWPLRNNETEAGVSLHLIDKGIDNGEIVDQIIFEIPPFLTSIGLYKLYNCYGYELFKRNLFDIIHDNTTSTPQNESAASYFSRSSINFEEVEIESFEKPCTELVNHIRSLIFEPYQLPTFQNNKIIACDYIHWPDEGDNCSIPGQVMIYDTNHAVVRCLDGYIRLEFINEHK